MNTQVTISIDEQELRDVLAEALEQAYQFEMTGWRIPVYVANDGEVTTGSWLGQGSYQPDLHELPVRITSWDLGYEADEYDISNEVDERVDFIIRHLKEDNQIAYGLFFELV